MNSLLEEKTDLFDDAVDFTKIEIKDYLPALDASIKEAKEKIEKIKKEPSCSFKSIVEQLELSSDRLEKVTNVFYALFGAHSTDELVEISEEFNQKLTEYSSDIFLDEKLFSQIKKVYESNEKLDDEQKRLLEKNYSSFTRNGALLKDGDKEILRKIDQNLSQLSLSFSENCRKATNDYILFIKDKNKLEGIPESALEAAKALAKENNREGEYAFSLQYPSYAPFMKYCEDRELRKKMSIAMTSKATKGEFDNSKIVIEIIKLRSKRAKLLGYKDHVDFTLEKRMASNIEIVRKFIDDLYLKCYSQAKEELIKLKEINNNDEVYSYDVNYLSEKLKKKCLDLDEEALRAYFKLENVIEGAFKVANKLYGLDFTLREDIPTYHKDVKVYEVRDKEKYIGLFYTDFFPRKEKRSGAWMTNLREQGLSHGENKRPHVMIVCNFSPSTETKPSLIYLNSVKTLFHEFGHALHGLLSQAKYRSMGGTNVYWDFVELPSQIMENWVTEKECLQLFAKHYKTGEVIPDELIEKIKDSEKFLSAMATMRQLSFSSLDIETHALEEDKIDDIFKIESKFFEKYNLYKKNDGENMSCSFGHLYGGGYSAGYYSYKWAEVLDADAFSLFKKNGIFDSHTANSFRENILEKGGSEDPMKLYKIFRGREPEVDALLERAGLI